MFDFDYEDDFEDENEETPKRRRRKQKKTSIKRLGIEVGEAAYSKEGKHLGKVHSVVNRSVVVVSHKGVQQTYDASELWWG